MLTHIDKLNNPTMVNVKDKNHTQRKATAEAFLRVPDEIIALLCEGEIKVKKGPVFATAIIAGTMAVKRCSELIPFCHPIPLEGCQFQIDVIPDNRIHLSCTVNCTYKTGVEMEALTGVSVASLTIYDMCKAVSHDIEIGPIKLQSKEGGKSDYES